MTVFPELKAGIATPSRNADRLAALNRYAVFDTAAEAGFDDLARLAAQLCGVKTGLITFVDDKRQFFKARVGFNGGPFAPTDQGFCPIVVRNAAALVVSDTHAQPGYADYADYPVVKTGGVRFYAGVPLITSDGHTLGALCVLDTVPRTLAPEQLAGLDALAGQVVGQLELRRALRLASAESSRAEQQTARVARQAHRTKLLAQVSAKLIVASDAGEMVRDIHAGIATTFQIDVCLSYACTDGGLALMASAGLTAEQAARAARLEFGQAVCGTVAASRQAWHVSGIQTGDDPRAAFLKGIGIDSYMCMPLLAGDELLGTLGFGRSAGPFSPGEREVLQTLAFYAALAMVKLQATRLLAAKARRQGFLVALSDLLRDFADPRDAMFAAAKLLGGHLMVDRVGYAEIDGTGDHATVECDWASAGATSFAGRYRLASYDPSLLAGLRAGRTMRFDEVLDGHRAAGAIGADVDRSTAMRAKITVPLIKDGRFIATFQVASRNPRRWTDEEEALVRAVAERTWAAVERARAEAALREAKGTLEQQVAERTAALQASEAQLRTLFETSYHFLALLEPGGTVLDANATSLAAIGSTLEDVLRKPFPDTPWFTGTPGMPERVRAAVEAAAQGEAVHQDIVLKLPAGWRSFDLAMRPIRNASGVIVAIAPEATETTLRRQTEDALRQSQKMEAVGQLTGGIAHDFNNMLQGITGSLDIMQRRIVQGRSGEIDHLVAGAMASASRAAALTHRLLAFSRRQALSPKPVHSNPLIASMEDLLRRTMGGTIQLDLLLADELWLTLCDSNQLENAILNLVINARDAMPDGGTLTIETCNMPLASPGAAAACNVGPGDYVRIAVTDTGIGMPPEVMEHAFDPFFTTKPIGQGTGLGLSMIYGFAQQSKGSCTIDSEAGLGTTVQLCLPRHRGEVAEAGSPAKLAETPDAGNGEVVLVVEDEAVVRELVVEVLRDLGYRALEAVDGMSGLDVLQSRQRVDLLVTDIGLPGLNGRQMADAARERRPDLKVLFMTGYAENATMANGSLEPGMSLIVKPFAMNTLATRIRGMIGASLP